MIKVNIWKFTGIVSIEKIGKHAAWGHASMQVGETYISWWPEANGRRHSRILNSIYSASPIRNQTFEDDIMGEYNRQPDSVVEINGLDENAIKNWWQSFGLTRDGHLFSGPLPEWQTISQNCSTVVAKALIVGGADIYSNWIKPGSYPFWTPNDVYAFAITIKNGLEKIK